MAIELEKTEFSCGHFILKGSTFGYAPKIAVKYAREAGYLVEVKRDNPCPECVSPFTDCGRPKGSPYEGQD